MICACVTDNRLRVSEVADKRLAGEDVELGQNVLPDNQQEA
jgi:hypothetical protein